MDQEFINRVAPGSVITVQVERQEGFMDRGGMATSTRKAWSTLTNNNIYFYRLYDPRSCGCLNADKYKASSRL